jgi:hypothetical protein
MSYLIEKKELLGYFIRQGNQKPGFPGGFINDLGFVPVFPLEGGEFYEELH